MVHRLYHTWHGTVCKHRLLVLRVAIATLKRFLYCCTHCIDVETEGEGDWVSSGDSRQLLVTLGCYIRCTRPFLLDTKVLPHMLGSIAQKDKDSLDQPQHSSVIRVGENPSLLLPTWGALSYCT